MKFLYFNVSVNLIGRVCVHIFPQAVRRRTQHTLNEPVTQPVNMTYGSPYI